MINHLETQIPFLLCQILGNWSPQFSEFLGEIGEMVSDGRLASWMPGTGVFLLVVFWCQKVNEGHSKNIVKICQNCLKWWKQSPIASLNDHLTQVFFRWTCWRCAIKKPTHDFSPLISSPHVPSLVPFLSLRRGYLGTCINWCQGCSTSIAAGCCIPISRWGWWDLDQWGVGTIWWLMDPPVKVYNGLHTYGKSALLIGKSPVNGPFYV